MKKHRMLLYFVLVIILGNAMYANTFRPHLNFKNSVKEKRLIASNTILLLPTATIAGTTTVCQNATSPVITFTGSGGTAPYTFTYKINGILQPTITTVTGESILLAVSSSAPGIFTYDLVSVHDTATPIPEQPSLGTAIVTVSSPQIVDFTFNNDTTCSGTSIQFTSSVTGTGPNNFTWDFGDGSPLSNLQNPTHSFNSLGCGNVTFIVVLTVVSNSCTVTRQHIVTVKQKPDISFNDVNNLFDPFSNCGNASSNSVYSITVGNTSTTTTTCISSFSINWGDGNSQTNIKFPISHTYSSIGAYSMTISANGNNGCVSTKTYVVKNVSNPLGGLNSPGSTQNLCAPTTNLQFSISNWGGNSLDTTYKINYSDGSPIVILTQNQLNSSTYYNTSNPLNSTNYPIPHTYTTSSCPAPSFEVKLEITNACGMTPLSLGNISILTKPTTNFTVPANGCVNNSILFTNTTISGYGQNCIQGSIYSWDFGDVSPIITTPLSAPQNINHTYSNAGTYTVILTAQNGCGNATKTQQICIEPPLVPQFTLNNNFGCTPQSITATNTTNTTNSCTPPTYLWSVIFSPSICGTSIATITNQNTTNASFNFTEPGTYTITLTATNSCGSFPTSQTVTVKKPPTVTLNSIATLCQTMPTTAINLSAVVTNCGTLSPLVYEWIFPSGTPPTSTAANPGTISYSTSGTFPFSLKVTNECGSTTANSSFIINPSPTITGTLFSCVGFTSQLTGSATAATSSPWTSSAPTIATVSSTGLVTGLSGGTTTITYTNSNNCKITALFTVNPAPTITQPSSSTICLGGTPSVLSVTIRGATGTPTYQWFSNIANNTTSGTAILGEINATYNPPNSVVGTIYYYCIVTLPSGGCSSILSNTATVTINAGATISTQPTATQSLCVGVTIASPLTVSSSGGTGTPTYQWFSNTIKSNNGGTIISGATNASFTPSVFTTTGNYYYYVVVSLSGNGCGPVTSDVAEVIVYADPTVSSQPLVSQTLCQNAIPLNLDVTATGGNGIFNYQWHNNSANSTSGGILIAGATSNSYTPITNTVGTKYYYCIVSQNSTSGCSVTSATAAIIVISAPTITQPSSSTICVGGTLTPLSIIVSGGTGTAQYQWYSNVANNTTTGILISGETNATYNPPNSVVGTIYYYCSVTLPSGGCSSILSNTATVTINARATISTQPTATQSLCVGGTITIPLTVSYSRGIGTVSYQWFSNTTNSNTGGTSISAATSASYSPSVFTISGPFYYYVVLNFSGSGCGAITSNVAQVIVVNDPVISAQPIATQTVCQTATPSNLVVSVTGGINTSYSYQWYSNASNNITSGRPITGETSDTYSPQTTAVGTTYYYCLITQTNGSGCNVSSDIAAVIVNPAPTITNQPVSSSVCVNGSPTLLSFTYINGVGIPSYQWYSNSVNSTIGGTIISGAINPTFAPPAISTGIIYYYCVVTFSSLSGSCSVITTNSVSVIVNPNPIIASETAIICSTSSFTVSPNNSGGNIVPIGTTYTWTNPTISPAGSINGASAEGIPQTNISQTLINTITNPSTVTYMVTPKSGSCVGNNFTVVVTVNPSINPNSIVKNSTCFAANNGSIQTTITGGIPFSSGNSYIISWSGPNGFTSNTSNISNLSSGDYTLSVLDNGGCPFSKTYTITEPADILITTDLEKDITCFGNSNGAIQITVTGGAPVYNYSWTKNGIPFSTLEDLSGVSPGIYQVTVSDVNNCGPKTATFTITEPPVLVLNLISQTNILCFGTANGAINVNVVGGTPSVSGYNFAWTGPNGFKSTNQNLTAIPVGTYNLTVTDNSACSKNLLVTLTQNPEIIINAVTTPIICYGYNDGSINITISGGIAPYTILWSNLGSGLFQNNLSAGDYLITVTDVVGCQKILNVTIQEPPIFTITPVTKNITCFGAHNGSINLNIVGGIAPVVLKWDDSATAGNVRNNLGPGSYTVTITDSKPCVIKQTFIIQEPQLLVLSSNVTNAFDCDNANSGAINLLVSGGSAPFTYAWSNGTTTEDLTNIPAGNYLVTVTDARGCVKTAEYSINRPPPIVIGVETKTDFSCDTKYVKQSFVAQVSGGVPPYQLNWSSGTVSGLNNEIMNTNQNGTVILNVTDNLGCKANYTFNVKIPILGSPSFTTTSIAYNTYGVYSISDPIQFQGSITGDYLSVSWDFGDGTFSTEINPTHTYIIPKDYIVTQTVTYPFGCVYVYKITLTLEKGYILVVPNAFTPNDDGVNDTYRPVTKALKNVHLDVYDTWGSLIYSETGNVLRGWDGTIKGIKAENGNYFGKVSAETFYGLIINENSLFVLIK